MELCLHCEAAAVSAEPRHRHLRLCDRCAAVRGLRVIYKRRTDWTPEWDAHLQRLVERAKLRLPLFEDRPHEDPRRRPTRHAG